MQIDDQDTVKAELQNVRKLLKQQRALSTSLESSLLAANLSLNRLVATIHEDKDAFLSRAQHISDAVRRACKSLVKIKVVKGDVETAVYGKYVDLARNLCSAGDALLVENKTHCKKMDQVCVYLSLCLCVCLCMYALVYVVKYIWKYVHVMRDLCSVGEALLVHCEKMDQVCMILICIYMYTLCKV
jgi:hypothetical protein